MIKMRLLNGSGKLIFAPRRSGKAALAWQLQREGCTLAHTVAMSRQRSTHFLSRQHATMQAKAMAAFLCSKSVTEDAGQVLRRNTDAIIDHDNFNSIAPVANTERELSVYALGTLARVLGVANQVDENLQHLVLFDRDRWHVLNFFANFNIVPIQTTYVHVQGIFDQIGDVDGLSNA